MKPNTMLDLLEAFKRLNYEWPAFHLVGVRSSADLPNEFDDLFYLIDGTNIYHFTGTTNPGRAWLKKPGRIEGTAVLKPGQYINCWQLGLHRGMYKAWVQVKPVTVYRDNNLDDKSDETFVQQKGLLGINIHRSSENWISKFVDKWSAGCQVLNNPPEYRQFIKASENSGQHFFTYTLLKESQLTK